jgi:hypothetical protein
VFPNRNQLSALGSAPVSKLAFDACPNASDEKEMPATMAARASGLRIFIDVSLICETFRETFLILQQFSLSAIIIK